VNFYYFYCLDEDFGQFFIKFGSYFPYTAKLCINGHEYLKCQLDRRAGYRYDLSILQAEFSLTQIWDQAVSGRCFFEEIIRENIDLGRPEQVQLIFSRKMNKSTVADGRCRTRIITQGVIPSLHIYYKSMDFPTPAQAMIVTTLTFLFAHARSRKAISSSRPKTSLPVTGNLATEIFFGASLAGGL
jgi:hypothetical protein